MKHYLIDSENVGDFWIPLLDLPAESAELIVFYTKNSPHMSYDSLIKLKESDRKVTFVKCYEGTNALDFQLCSELGFLIALNEGDDFIIVTNDTGYDAAVKYWRRKEYSVKRIAGKDARTGSRRRGNNVRSDVAAEVSSILHRLSQTAGPGEADAEDGIAAAVSGNEAGSEGSAIEIFEPEEYGADEPEYDESGSDESEYEETDYDESGSDESDYDEPGYEESDYDEPGYEESDYEESDYEESDYDDSDYDESGSDEDDYDESESDDSDYDVFGSGDAEYDESDTNDRDEPDIDGTVYDEAECGGDDSDGSQADYRNGEESGSEASDGDRPDEAQIDGSVSGESSKDALTDGSAETEEQEFHADPEELTAIVNCIGMDNLAELHNQLIQFYGENGKDVYKSLKSLAPSIEKKGWSREEKFLYYCVLILRHSDEPEEALREENVRELAEFLLGAENKRKNLNSLRYAMLKHYGKEKGRRYYFMLKPYVKALNQM